MIIDSHVHISYLDKEKNFLDIKNDLLLNMRKSGISRSIVIPDNIHKTQCADLETVINLTQKEPKLFAIGTLKIEEVDRGTILKISELFEKRVIRGFKIFPGHDPVYPTDKRWEPIYELCQKYDFPLIIHTGINSNDTACAKYNDPKYIAQLATDRPNLKIIIAHYFWPKLDYCFSITNGFKNIYFDTSAIADPEVVEKSGGIKKVREILEKTMKRNPDSVLFGTDWPICDVEKHITLIKSLKISKEEKEKIFCKNSLKIFKLEK